MGQGLWQQLHYYFDVTNSYVTRKLYLLLLPFLQSGEWRQTLNDSGQVDSPRYNLFAPDLYIPCMSFITFLLFTGINAGSRGEFSPEVLGITGSAGIAIVTIEVVLIYGGFYLL